MIPLDGALGDAASDFNPSLIQRMTYQGKLYGVPQVMDTQLLVYRKSMLDKAGVNTVLRTFGITPVAWLLVTHPPWYWLVLVTLRLWCSWASYIILFLVGLQRIPVGLYEAAVVDGAKPGWQVFRHITLPAAAGRPRLRWRCCC